VSEHPRNEYGNPIKCFHVDAGKPCTRYLEGSEAMQRETIAFLEAIPEAVIHDWGLNAVAELIDLAKAGAVRDGARYWDAPSTELPGTGEGE